MRVELTAKGWVYAVLDNEGRMTYAELWRAVQRQLPVVTGRQFDESLRELLDAELVECLEHEDERAREGGAPAEYRTVRRAN